MKAVFNRHKSDFRCGFTIEFDVKLPNLPLTDAHEELLQSEWESGFLTNYHSEQCFEEIMESNYPFITDWSFAGRSNGWWVLVCEGDESQVRSRSLSRIERIVEKYFNSYGQLLLVNFDNYLKEEAEQVS